MNIFKEQSLLEFSDRFKTDGDCKELLAKSYSIKKEFKRVGLCVYG